MALVRTLFRFAALAAISATFAACGGGQTALNAMPAVSNRTPAALLSVGANGAITLSGSVVAVLATYFEIQGGHGVGYLHVYTNSNTTYTGAKPYVGETVKITGTGSVSTSVTASSVTDISAAATSSTASAVELLKVTGPIDSLGASGSFHVHGPTGIGYIWIHPTATTTYSGAKPYVGETVSVEGTGSYATSITAVTVAQVSPTTSSTPAPTMPPAAPSTMTTAPATSAFMPSSWGKISAFQVFDDTGNGYISQSAAAANGWRYSAVWGSRNNIGTSWLNSNRNLQTGYYNALETDESYTSWGAIGHNLTWWKSNHPDWVLYACTSSGSVTTTPAWVPSLPNNVPLDIHNPAVVQYQVRMMADYAHQLGYRALAIDEATFWQADQGAGSGSYGCGIYQNGSFVRRYSGVEDANWVADVVQWVKIAHSILTTDPTIAAYHLKLIVNHPANSLSTSETTFLANVDADLDETGYSSYGNYKSGSASTFVMRTNWATYAQQHGVAVLMNDNWGPVSVTTPILDYSIATYLMGNQQAESLFASAGSGYGLEQWHSQYQTAMGAPCGAYYGGSSYDPANPSVYYRRFQNAVVVVNGGSGYASESAHLPVGHTYTDILGRAVSNPLTIASNDGYVLLTSNGCR